MGFWSDLLGTLASTFGIGSGVSRAILDTTGLTAPRTFTFPDEDGELSVGGGGGATAFNAIGDAAASGTIDNTNYNQVWNWSSINTAESFELQTNGETALLLGNDGAYDYATLGGYNANVTGRAVATITAPTTNITATSNLNCITPALSVSTTGASAVNVSDGTNSVSLYVDTTDNMAQLSTTGPLRLVGSDVSLDGSTTAVITSPTITLTSQSTGGVINAGDSTNTININVQTCDDEGNSIYFLTTALVISTYATGAVVIGDATNTASVTINGAELIIASSEVGFFGATPSAQQTYSADFTDSTGGTPGTTLAAVGDTSTGDESGPINDNFASLNAKINTINAILKTFGLEASS